MKKIIVIATVLFSAAVYAQTDKHTNVGTFVEKTYTDAGKVLDFKAGLLATKNLTTNAVETKLVLESKSFTSSDAKVIELDKAAVNDLLNSLKSFKTKYLGTILPANADISMTSTKGYEIGGTFTLDKPTASASTTKKEKYYVETKEKYYEGKLVNRDATGSYIWKEITTTAAPKDPTGKWAPYFKLINGFSQVTYTMTVEDLDNFIKFLEETATKL